MFRRCCSSFCLLFVFFLAGCNIEGRITTPDGQGLVGVTVTLTGDANLTTKTDRDGYYLFRDLNSGSYTVTPAMDGYRWAPQSQTIIVQQDDVFGIDFEAEPAHHIRVPRDYNTIQEAVDAASEGDTIWLADGHYTGHGNYNVTIDKKITIQSDNGPASCTIDCEGNGRGFILVDDAILSGLTIINGSHFRGGGIITASAASPRIINCVIQKNQSIEAGGGIYTSGGQPQIIDSVISDNTTSHDGGGLCINSGQPIISGSTIFNNNARVGGGISVINATISLTGSVVSHNHAIELGGGWYSSDGQHEIKRTFFHENISGTSGGGLYFNHGSSKILHSTIADNGGVDGGGIFVEFGRHEIDHCILWRNTVDQIQTNAQSDLVISNAVVGQEDISGDCVSNADPQFDEDGGYYLLEESPCSSVNIE